MPIARAQTTHLPSCATPTDSCGWAPPAARAGTVPWQELSATYGRLFMEGLALLGTRRKHVNVLQHLMGYLKRNCRPTTTRTFGTLELLGLIEDYRNELVPLIVPMTLLKHHLNRCPVPEWVHQQVYLNPYPKELLLRNHV